MSEILGSIRSAGSIKILMLLLTSDKRISELAKLSDQSVVMVCMYIRKMESAGVVIVDRKNARNSIVRLCGLPKEGVKLILQVLRNFRGWHDEEERCAPTGSYAKHYRTSTSMMIADREC